MTTIILPVSRIDYLTRIFAQLELMECDKENTNLFVLSDGDWRLFEKARNLTINSKFKERLCVYRHKGIPSYSSQRRRRKRIADMHNEIKEYINKSDYYFLLEDDTMFPLNTLQILLKMYEDHPHAGFVSGVQIGRHGFDHIGAWRVNDVYGPTAITSVPLGEGVAEVDAAGIYCCLTKNYMEHTFEPFEDILGPDFSFGLWLRKQGLKNYINYDLKLSHLTKKKEITFQNTDIIQLEFEKTDRWALKKAGVASQ